MDYRPASFISDDSGGRLFTPSPSPTEHSPYALTTAHVPARKPVPRQTIQQVTPYNPSTALPLMNAEDAWQPIYQRCEEGARYDTTPAESNVERKIRSHADVPRRASWQLRRNGLNIPSWWWWEIASMALSCVCVILLLILLLKANDMPLEKWPLPIQPNSLIAVLTTVGKSAMMVPIAACISQLKWRHFEKQEDELQRLQVFEDASRGPWGSVVLLLRMPTQAMLAWAFALVTVIALGFDPSAQQILDFPQRTSPLTNISSTISKADNYFSKAFIEGVRTNSRVPNPDLLKLQSSIVNGASGQVFQPNFHCPEPATSCSWPKFTTLGICSTFDDFTDQATYQCEGNTRSALNCTYDFPGRKEDETQVEMSFNDVGTTNHMPTDLFRSQGSVLIDENQVTYVALTAVRVTDSNMGGTTPPKTQVLRSTWYYCAQTVDSVDGSPRQLATQQPQTEKLNFVSLTTVAEDPNTMGTNYMTFSANSTGQKYNITRNGRSYLLSYLNQLLSKRVVESQLALRTDADLDMGFFLHTSDLAALTANIATTLTNQIRSNNPGDNANATVITGTASFREVYIRVRWPWFILPSGLTIATMLLFALSLLATRSQPVLKESVIAYLAYGMERNAREDLLMREPRMGDEMEEAARSVKVRLLGDGDGRVTFAKA